MRFILEALDIDTRKIRTVGIYYTEQAAMIAACELTRERELPSLVRVHPGAAAAAFRLNGSNWIELDIMESGVYRAEAWPQPKEAA